MIDRDKTQALARTDHVARQRFGVLDGAEAGEANQKREEPHQQPPDPQVSSVPMVEIEPSIAPSAGPFSS